MGINLADIIKGCKKFWSEVTAQNGLVKNQDGTISVYISNSNGISSPAQVSQQCCNVLAEMTGESYYYDLDAQKCRWSDKSSIDCADNQPFKIVLNPKGNDGTIFYFQDNEKCSLVVDFDYLFKLDCETLSKTLSQTSAADPALHNQIIKLEEQIAEQTVKCEEITTHLTYLLDQYNKTSYSITCDKFPAIPPVVVVGSTPIEPREPLPTDTIKPTQTQKEPFTKTGFNGGLAPFSFPKIKFISVNFCLTTDGITVWQNILGANRYQAFLNGDPLSYTCADVINIYNQNQTLLSVAKNVNPLIVDCKTPFGTKSDIQKEIDKVVIEQANCEKLLTSLKSELDDLQVQQQDLVSGCDSPIAVMENLSVSMSIDVVGANGDLTTAYEYNFFPAIGAGNLYDYLVSHPNNSGFFVCGEPSVNETWATGCTPLSYPELSPQTQTENTDVDEMNVSTCLMVRDYILQTLFDESGLASQSNGQTTFTNSLAPTILSSAWSHYTTSINDVDVINMIANKKIKLSLNVKSSCGDFCVLIDSIALTKQCVDVDSTSLFVSQSPGFNLTRVIDNKKSWLNNTSLVNREFDIKHVNGFNSIRQTDYDVLDERLVINTKEIDLDMNIASAVEYDVWCYLSDNPCLLTGVTYCDPCIACGDKNFQDDECFVFQDLNVYDFMDNASNNVQLFSQSYCCGDNKIDFNSLLTTDLSTIKTIDNFKNLMVSELINVKNRKTISGYPTLKALYERYLNSLKHCGTKSSAFDYYTMDEFANLIGDYWVDIIEQVIPATTIWGSVKIYTNTIFDQQKFKYREYSSLFGANPFQCLNVLSPINGISGQCQTVDVITTVISVPKEGELTPKPVYNHSDKLCIAQMNWGSEFIGTVSIDDGTGIQQPYADLCDPTVTPPPVHCTIDPLKYFIERVVECDSLVDLLNDGLFLPNCDYCCPDCNDYVIGSTDKYLEYLGVFGGDNPCCFNYGVDNARLDDLEQYVEATNLILPTNEIHSGYNVGTGCTGTTFVTGLDLLETKTSDYSEILNLGIMEQSTINGSSGLSTIVNELSDFDPNQVYDFMTNLLNEGLVITCKDGTIRFMSITNYIILNGGL
jgi:hypothetical protein